MGKLKIGLIGPSYVQRSLPFDAQRTVNLFPIIDEAGAETASLLGTPGLSLFCVCGAGPHRGSFRSANGRTFVVSDSRLFEVLIDGSSVFRGNLLTSNGRVSMTEGLTQLAISDGIKLYYLTYSNNNFAQVTDSDLPSVIGFVTNLDGYFIINSVGTGRFYISSLNDVSNWNALDFATAESNADVLIAPINAVGQLWLMGETTTEIWSNSGAATFPFSRVGNVVMQAGLLAAQTALEIDNSIMFVGRDKYGSAMVYRASGFTPSRVSTEPIEKILQKVNTPNELFSWSYQQEGHLFYVISGSNLETSLVYDLTTQSWHERAYTNEFGNFEQHLGATCVFAFNKHLVGDRINGNLYEMSLDYYTDNGEEITRERTYTHLIDESKRIRYNSLEIGVETGVGLQSGQGSAPIISLQVSKDGARTWSDWFDASIGAVGKYLTKVVFRRLGIAEIMTFKIRITDPVKVSITGSYLK